MSTDLTIAKRTLPPEMPEINARHALASQIFLLTDPMCEGGPAQENYSPAMRQAAKTAIEVYAPFIRPVTHEILIAWTDPIPGSVRNERSPDATLRWLDALMLAVDGFPCGAFTVRTQREALQTFQFFPSVADVCAVLAPAVSKIRNEMRALRHIAREP